MSTYLIYTYIFFSLRIKAGSGVGTGSSFFLRMIRIRGENSDPHPWIWIQVLSTDSILFFSQYQHIRYLKLGLTRSSKDGNFHIVKILENSDLLQLPIRKSGREKRMFWFFPKIGKGNQRKTTIQSLKYYKRAILF